MSAVTGVLGKSMRRAALVCALGATYMAVLDTFIVNIAAPIIQLSLRMSFLELEATFVGYTIPYGGSLVLGGRLGDHFGYKRVFLIGLFGFAASSLLCSVAGTPVALILGRMGQGLSAGLMLPQVLSLIRILFPEPREQAVATSYFSVAVGLGMITGQVAGGLIISVVGGAEAWRGVFIVNLPFAALAFIAGMFVLPSAQRPTHISSLDWVGAITQIVGVSLLLTGISGLLLRSFTIALAACLIALGIAVLYVFFVTQRRHERAGIVPLVPPSLFRDRTFRTGLATIFAFSLTPGILIVLTYQLQTVVGLSSFQTALIFLTYSLPYAITALTAPRLITKYGQKLIWQLLLVATVLLLPILLALVLPPIEMTPIAVVPALVALGLVQGINSPSLLSVVLRSSQSTVAGAVSGVLLTGMQTANAAGVAVIVGAFFSVLQMSAEVADKNWTEHMALWIAFGICGVFSGTSAFMMRKLSQLSSSDARNVQ